jgi:hypothetical protein
VVLAILILLQLGGIVLFLRVPVVEKDPFQEQAPTQRNTFREALTQPLIWLTAIFLLVYSGVEICASSWGYTYMVENQALEPLAAGWVVSGFGIGLTLGRFLIQPMAERKGGQRNHTHVHVDRRCDRELADHLVDAVWHSGCYWLLSSGPQFSPHLSTDHSSCTQTRARAPRTQRNRSWSYLAWEVGASEAAQKELTGTQRLDS